MQENFYCPSYSYGIPTSSPLAGHNSWPADASFSTPVSSAFYGTTATASWAHTVPTLMPWVTEANASSAEPVIRFTAPFPPDPCTSQTATSWELLNNLGNGRTNANLHLKRRNDAEEPVFCPRKQCITEEKMAARLRELHISNNYSVPQQNSQFGPYGDDVEKSQKNIKTLAELETMVQDSGGEKFKGSLILSPEIKSLVEPEKLFTKTFVNEVERPTMAVVLWKPPQGPVKDLINSSLSSSTNDSEDDRLRLAGQSECNNNSSIYITNTNPQLNITSQTFLPPVLASPSASSSEDVDCLMEA